MTGNYLKTDSFVDKKEYQARFVAVLMFVFLLCQFKSAKAMLDSV